jgi:hypothetical protein
MKPNPQPLLEIFLAKNSKKVPEILAKGSESVTFCMWEAGRFSERGKK